MIVVGFWGPSEWEGWQQPDLNGDLSLPMLTILYILFCNVLHCLSRITIFYILFCNVLHCFCRIAILYILFCNFLHCLCRIAILYILFSMLLIFTPPKVDNMPPKVSNLAPNSKPTHKMIIMPPIRISPPETDNSPPTNNNMPPKVNHVPSKTNNAPPQNPEGSIYHKGSFISLFHNWSSHFRSFSHCTNTTFNIIANNI